MGISGKDLTAGIYWVRRLVEGSKSVTVIMGLAILTKASPFMSLRIYQVRKPETCYDYEVIVQVVEPDLCDWEFLQKIECPFASGRLHGKDAEETIAGGVFVESFVLRDHDQLGESHITRLLLDGDNPTWRPTMQELGYWPKYTRETDLTEAESAALDKLIDDHQLNPETAETKELLERYRDAPLVGITGIYWARLRSAGELSRPHCVCVQYNFFEPFEFRNVWRHGDPNHHTIDQFTEWYGPIENREWMETPWREGFDPNNPHVEPKKIPWTEKVETQTYETTPIDSPAPEVDKTDRDPGPPKPKPLEVVLAKFPDAVPTVLFVGTVDDSQLVNAYRTTCPLHKDMRTSLMIMEGANNRVRLRCTLRCNTADICKAVGLNASDLFPPPRGETMDPEKSDDKQESATATYGANLLESQTKALTFRRFVHWFDLQGHTLREDEKQNMRILFSKGVLKMPQTISMKEHEEIERRIRDEDQKRAVAMADSFYKSCSEMKPTDAPLPQAIIDQRIREALAKTTFTPPLDPPLPTTKELRQKIRYQQVDNGFMVYADDDRGERWELDAKSWEWVTPLQRTKSPPRLFKRKYEAKAAVANYKLPPFLISEKVESEVDRGVL